MLLLKSQLCERRVFSTKRHIPKKISGQKAHKKFLNIIVISQMQMKITLRY